MATIQMVVLGVLCLLPWQDRRAGGGAGPGDRDGDDDSADAAGSVHSGFLAPAFVQSLVYFTTMNASARIETRAEVPVDSEVHFSHDAGPA